VQMSDEALSDLFDAENPIPIAMVLTDGPGANASFVSIVVPYASLTKDDNDDGKKQIVANFDFIAGINPNGGPALASHQTIVSIQDSAA
jgi:hypothetical protein